MKLKKILGLLLVAVLLVGSLPSAAFAATNKTKVADNAKLDKAKFQEEIDAVAAKIGAKAVILENVDPSTVKLQFNSVKDFENSIGKLHEKLNVPQSADQLVQPMDFTGKFKSEYPHPVWLGSYEVIGYITQEVWATEYWNSYYEKNLFSQVTYHTSYIAPYGVGFSWSPNPYTHSIIDGGRTIEASADGQITLGVKIGDYEIGFTWSMDMTDWFYAV